MLRQDWTYDLLNVHLSTSIEKNNTLIIRLQNMPIKIARNGPFRMAVEILIKLLTVHKVGHN